MCLKYLVKRFVDILALTDSDWSQMCWFQPAVFQMQTAAHQSWSDILCRKYMSEWTNKLVK